MTHVAGSTPYAWPYDGKLDATATALVVAGWDAGWAARVGPAAVATAREPCVRLADVTGIVVTLAHPVRAGRAEVVPSGPPPPPLPAAISITAAGVSGFYGSPLDAVLRGAGIRTVVLAGLGLEAPIHSTMRDANDRGYECLLVLDAAAPVDPALAASAASQVHMSGGIFGATACCADVVAALDRPHLPAPAPTPEGPQP